MKRSMDTAIQILMATYNGERYVKTQLDSILAQTYENFELIVSDDSSTDGTRDILRNYADAYNRIRLVDSGMRFGNARDHFLWLLSQASAPYIAFCDQDDLWLSDKLALGMEKMRELEGVWGADTPLLVFSDLAVAADDLSIINPSFMSYSGLDPSYTELPHLLVQNLAPGCTIIANRCLYRSTLHLPDDSSSVIMHDWWLMLTASALGHIGYLDQPTMLYRQHEHNSMGAERESLLGVLRRIGAYVDRFVPSDLQLDSIDARLAQAEAFTMTYADELDSVSWQLCKGFASVLGLRPLERLRWCQKHGIRNSAFLAQLGLDWELLFYDTGRRRQARPIESE